MTPVVPVVKTTFGRVKAITASRGNPPRLPVVRIAHAGSFFARR
jgi:hypothetical protein